MFKVFTLITFKSPTKRIKLAPFCRKNWLIVAMSRKGVCKCQLYLEIKLWWMRNVFSDLKFWPFRKINSNLKLFKFINFHVTVIHNFWIVCWWITTITIIKYPELSSISLSPSPSSQSRIWWDCNLENETKIRIVLDTGWQRR